MDESSTNMISIADDLKKEIVGYVFRNNFIILNRKIHVSTLFNADIKAA